MRGGALLFPISSYNYNSMQYEQYGKSFGICSTVSHDSEISPGKIDFTRFSTYKKFREINFQEKYSIFICKNVNLTPRMSCSGFSRDFVQIKPICLNSTQNVTLLCIICWVLRRVNL